MKGNDDEARRLREELEERVFERTAQLAAANEALSLQEISLKQAVASLSQREALLAAQIAERDRAEEALHRLNSDLVRAQKRTTQILRTLEAVSGSLELDQVLGRIASELASAVGFSHTVIYLHEPDRGRLSPRAVYGDLSPDQAEILREQLARFVGSSLVGAALEERKPLVSPNIGSDPRANPQLVEMLNIKSALIIPIQRSGKLLGMAAGYTTLKPHNFTGEEVELAVGMASAAALAIENAQLFGETRRRLAESESFSRVMMSLVRETELEKVLAIVCSEVQRLIGAIASAVLLIEKDGWLHVHQSFGSSRPPFDRLPVESSIAGLAFQQREPVLVNDPAHHPRPYRPAPDITALLAVPLTVNDGAIGVLEAMNKPGGFTEEDVRVMAFFASQVAMAIEHARLQRRAEQLAVVEERQRLARELHDSVTQALYGVTLFGNAASSALAAGKQEAAAGYLRKLRETAQEAMADMRLLIFELHPPALEKDGLVSALQTRLAAVETRAGLHTTLQIEGEERRLAIAVEEELYWIAQEALNNVLKHARASEATLRLEFAEGSTRLEVRDNGVGFAVPAAREQGGVGLRSIDERVARARGTWTLESTPGQGTCLTVEVPSGDEPRPADPS